MDCWGRGEALCTLRVLILYTKDHVSREVACLAPAPVLCLAELQIRLVRCPRAGAHNLVSHAHIAMSLMVYSYGPLTLIMQGSHNLQHAVQGCSVAAGVDHS